MYSRPRTSAAARIITQLASDAPLSVDTPVAMAIPKHLVVHWLATACVVLTLTFHHREFGSLRTETGRRATLEVGPPEEAVTELRAQMAAMRTAMEEMNHDSQIAYRQIESLSARVQELASEDRCGGRPQNTSSNHTENRRLQTGGDDLYETTETHADPAYIFKRQVTRIDPARSGDGHRRAQSTGACDATTLSSHTDAITAECCDGPEEDCSGGYPHTCNAGCAAIFLPFWDECRLTLGKSISVFEPTALLCEEVASTGLSIAERLNVECSDGTAGADCVPECSAEVHGYVLLLNIDDNDSKLTCERRNGLFSWVGAATEGGYIGWDPAIFLAALGSGAPGIYSLALTMDADVTASSVIAPGQTVSVIGDSTLPRWPKDFVVQRDASLSLSHISMSSSRCRLAGCLSISGAGSSVSLTGVVYEPDTMVGLLQQLTYCGELTPDAVDGVSFGPDGAPAQTSASGSTLRVEDVCGLTGVISFCAREDNTGEYGELPFPIDPSTGLMESTMSYDPPDLVDAVTQEMTQCSQITGRRN